MTPKPWSFSSLTNFVNCPKQFSEIRIYKNFEDTQGEVAKWGERAHKHLENYINGHPYHEDMVPYRAQVDGMLAEIGAEKPFLRNGTVAELQCALTGQLAPTDWFAKDVWVRGILDVLRVDGAEAWVVDWKMGKVKPDSRQLCLFALLVFYHFPDVQTVNTRFEWLQFGKSTKERYTRKQIPAMWQMFMSDLTAYVKAFKTETWQPRPSGLCRDYCAVTTCQHCGRK